MSHPLDTHDEPEQEMYVLGVDLGTTYSAAAVWRDGRAEIASLGSRSAAIPSVVLLRDDETVLTGESANRRGLTEPHRVAREFKRRLGDTTPIMLGGVPYSAEALMSRLLRPMIDEVSTREGGPPTAICISHPANWGPYKKELLGQAVRLANIDQPVSFTTEPKAAAVFYATQERIPTGAVVAVYDLGGGTFDAAVLRKTAHGFEILGQPEGIERLGGIDFDAAVFHHVAQALGGKLDELDEDDSTAVAAVARLREECVIAKETLSSDTDVTIPVLLPNIATEVRLTRAELEAMVRPTLYQTIEALRRALRSADVAPEQLHAVLLVGGSSRMPLVAQLVGAELGRPVAVDAHPKHAVALGAAWLASNALTGGGTVDHTPPASAAQAAAPPTRATAAVRPVGGQPSAQPATPAAPPPVAPAQTQALPAVPAPARVTPPAPPAGQSPVDAPPPPAVGPPSPTRRSSALIAGAVAVALLIGGGAVWALTQRGDDGDKVTAQPDPDALAATGSSPAAASEAPSSQEAAPPVDEVAVPWDEQCTDEVRANERWVCLTSAKMVDGSLVIEFDAEWAGQTPNVNGGYHVHIYGSDGTNPPDEIMGTHATNRGQWLIFDRSPIVIDHGSLDRLGGHPKVCARIANPSHELVPAQGGGYRTGNCVPIEST